jgi:SAM-dependent methyltransferase
MMQDDVWKPGNRMMADRAKALQMRGKFARLLIDQYLAGEHPPWSSGYILYRRQFISQVLSSPEAMSPFRTGQLLPPGYGFGLDERCVEYPWLLAQLDPQPERILDAGAILNHAFVLDQPIWQRKRIHMLTLAPEDYCYWDRGISYLFEDLRQIPIRDGFYDTIVCVSTLEHIGADHRIFTRSGTYPERVSGDFVPALREMHRVLKPSGRLFFSVPFGRYRDLGTQRVFDEGLLEQAIAAFGPQEVSRTFFRYSQQGWQYAHIGECKNCQYVDWVVLLPEHRSAQFPGQPDGATAARAVACVELKKGGIQG